MPRERHGPRVGTGEQQQVVDERGQPDHLGVDVVERPADARDRLVGMTPDELERAPDDCQRRPQLVARVGGELALAAQGQALGAQRFADRDECAPGVDRPEAERDEDDDRAADQQDPEDRVERLLLGGAVLDDLDEHRADVRERLFGADADGHVADLGRPDVDPGRCDAGGVDPLVDRERVGHEEAAATQRVAVGVGQQRERPGPTAAEAEALSGLSRVGVLAKVGGTHGQLLLAALLEGPGRDQVERRPEDDEDEQRREAAPRDELPADAVDEPGVGAERLELGRVAAAVSDPVRHR